MSVTNIERVADYGIHLMGKRHINDNNQRRMLGHFTPTVCLWDFSLRTMHAEPAWLWYVCCNYISKNQSHFSKIICDRTWDKSCVLCRRRVSWPTRVSYTGKMAAPHMWNMRQQWLGPPLDTGRMPVLHQRRMPTKASGNYRKHIRENMLMGLNIDVAILCRLHSD